MVAQLNQLVNQPSTESHTSTNSRTCSDTNFDTDANLMEGTQKQPTSAKNVLYYLKNTLMVLNLEQPKIFEHVWKNVAFQKRQLGINTFDKL